MKKFNTCFYVNGRCVGTAQCTIQEVKEYIANIPNITSCDGYCDDEYFMYSIEKGWRHFTKKKKFLKKILDKLK